jgi:CIC family chloride channel protein
VLTVFVVKVLRWFHRQRNFPNFIIRLQKASIVPKKQMYAQIITSSLLLDLRICRFRESIVVSGAALIKLCAALQTELQGQNTLIGCGVAAGIAALMLLLPVFYLLSNFTCRCQYSSIYSPSWLQQQQVLWSLKLSWRNCFIKFQTATGFDYHKIPFISF